MEITTAHTAMIKMVFDRWNTLIGNTNTLLDALTDEQLQQEIAPGRNRGIFLLGHLIAVHDEMFPILGFGEKLFPELHEPFLKSPDKTVAEIPSAKALRAYWNQMNEVLAQKFERMKPEEWFERHTLVSAEDFAKEPHRNKLNIILTRASHLSHHRGQFVLLVNKD